ncbi:MAG TPA: lysylphosphatidylglycerol synthase transmembrane domain-containing protein [Terriglobales bacterium]|nr:lysylphosphatidylglycerol synthase transmembrane domain-containing protein [Terriglobales bacterium]
MKKRQVFITLAVVVLLVVLAYLQFRSWRHFDWQTFLRLTAEADKLKLLAGVAFIYAGYIFRAWRWKMFLRPVKDVPLMRLLPPMIIGFTGLAVLGRPGDLIRPYLVARREDLRFTSQIAVLAVERVFDMASVAVFLAADLLFAPSLKQLQYFKQFEFAGMALFAGVIALALGLFMIWRNSAGAANVVTKIFGGFAPKAAQSIAHKIEVFGDGLHTIHNATSLLQIITASFLIWACISLAYLMVLHAYTDATLQTMSFSHVILLMSASVAGSLLQLPIVGGGTQLGTIGVLRHVFHVDENVAASCGIMLWLVTFMSVIPLGLLLARQARVSLAKLSEESHREG